MISHVPLSMLETYRSRLWKCRGGEEGNEGGEVQGPREPMGAAGEQWDGTETSAKGIRDLGGVRTYTKESALESLCRPAKPG